MSMDTTPSSSTSLASTIAQDTLVLILAGGRGSRLHEMTDRRSKPAVYFGGNWRIIDFHFGIAIACAGARRCFFFLIFLTK